MGSRLLLERSESRLLLMVLTVVVCSGCWTKYREDLDYSYRVQQTWPIEELHYGEIVQFESVFWEPDDTISLRELIVDDTIATGRDVLEIGTGTGLLSILCLQNDARRVVATDINEAAVANARYNAAMLVPDKELEVRQVLSDDPKAFSVIGATERFDLILSNPPWEDGQVKEPADHAFYDPAFGLMNSLLDGLPAHLNPGGRCLLAYGHRPGIEKLQAECERRGYEFKILDDRDLSSLDIDFLPGMLVEVRVPLNQGEAKPTLNSAAPSDGDSNQADESQTERSESDSQK
jgi:predicted RNA methylase